MPSECEYGPVGSFKIRLRFSNFRPNDRFDPRNIVRHSGVNAGRVYAAAVFPERRDSDLSVHTGVVGVRYLQRTAGIALEKKNCIFESHLNVFTHRTIAYGPFLRVRDTPVI